MEKMDFQNLKNRKNRTLFFRKSKIENFQLEFHLKLIFEKSILNEIPIEKF